MKEAADNKVEIKDVEPSSFEMFLQFIYCGKIPEDLQHYAIDLFVLADKVCLKQISLEDQKPTNIIEFQYEVEDLKILCEKHLAENITKDNAMEMFKFANLHSTNYDLKRMSFQIIKE